MSDFFDRPWFDPASGVLLLDEYVMERPSFKAITEDALIMQSELNEQTDRVVSLLRELESKLSPETKLLLTEALSEFAVLYVLHRKRLESVV